MAVTCFLSKFFNEYNDLNDLPNNGGSVTWYITGTTTPAAVYADHTGTVANTNPVILNSQGYPVAPIWLPITDYYDAVVKDALGNVVYELDYIGLDPDATAGATATVSIWINTTKVIRNTGTKTFDIDGTFDVLFTAGRRLKITDSGGDVYATVASAVYNGISDVTAVTIVPDGTSQLTIGAANVGCFYSAIDSINSPVPYQNYYAVNTGTSDALLASYDPSVLMTQGGVKVIVKTSATNTTTTPTFSANGQTPITITLNGGAAIAAGQIPTFADLLYDVAGNKAVLMNPSTTNDDAKWSAFPIGYCQPFIPGIMGTTLAAWLATHTQWAKLTNTQVAGIEGRAMAVSSATHLGNTQAGSDDAVVVAHTHTGTVAAHNHPGSVEGSHTHAVSDPGHYHVVSSIVASPSASFSSVASSGYLNSSGNTTTTTTGISISPAAATISIASDAPAVTVASTGVSATNANIQATVWFDWIYKVA